MLRRFSEIPDTILVTLLSALALLGNVTKVLFSLTTSAPCLATLRAMTSSARLLHRILELTKNRGLMLAILFFVARMSRVRCFTRLSWELLQISVPLSLLI